MPNDKILDLAKKLKALADRGIGGEQKNAVVKLHALLDKHGLTVADLEDEKLTAHAFSYKSIEKHVLSHIIWKVCGNVKIFGSRRKRNEFIIDCTHAQSIEILAMQDLYYRALIKELKLFTVAFILKNNLGTDGKATEPEKSRYSEEEKRKIINMMKGIDHNVSHKQIEIL